MVLGNFCLVLTNIITLPLDFPGLLTIKCTIASSLGKFGQETCESIQRRNVL